MGWIDVQAPAPATAVLSIEDQLAQYRAEPSIAVEDDPLTWWSQKEHKWPDLFDYAVRLLVIQGSETPSERAFSWAGDFYDDARAQMDPQVLSDYMMVYSNDPALKEWRRK